MPKVCVIVVTYNGEEYIMKCLSSLQGHSQDLHILVVDNDSKDQTVSIIEHNFPNVEVIRNKKNLGFGKANNIGLIQAYKKGYQYFFLLNQDAWIEGNAIEQIIAALKTNPSYGIVSPIHLNGTGDRLQHDFKFFMEKNEASDFLKHYESSRLNNELYEVDFVNAAAWMISRIALQKVGLFHPLFFHYGEDDNYVHRLHDKGLKIGVDSNSIIYHDHEIKSFNPLKHKPEKEFKQELLRAYLNPQNRGKREELANYAKKRKRKFKRENSLNGLTASWIKFKTMIEVYNHEKRYYKPLYRHLNDE
ncbi:glycosyltransferase family 2 protein [Ekhidna sp.]|uniref:glycosyltransferase family 2 protein n=1 Tax=Ekhidna sp. TaxID=2608089 RepID=UPI003B50B816